MSWTGVCDFSLVVSEEGAGQAQVQLTFGNAFVEQEEIVDPAREVGTEVNRDWMVSLNDLDVLAR